MTRPADADDVATYAADDALIDALADGTSWGQWGAADGDPVVELLASWRGELDDAVAAAGEQALGIDIPGSSRRARLRRHAATAAAVAVTLAASTGVAAAAGGADGPFGGLHRVLFGAPPAPARLDAVAGQVISLLDSAASRIETADRAGGVTAAQRASIGEQLDAAAGLLARDTTAPTALATRLAGLRTQLDQLDTLPTPAPDLPAVHLPVADRHGSGSRPQSTSDDGTSEQPSGDGGDGSSSDGTEGSSSGSDDATSGDSGSSSDSSSGGGSDDGSSTSDGGSSDSGSTTSDGSGSSGSGSGSDDGTTTSGSDSNGSDPASDG
jgi:hypothetical protein